MSEAIDDIFRTAVAQLGVIHAEIVALSHDDDQSWRRNLIALRRRLQTQITLLTELIDRTEPTDTRVLREALNRMRTTVALHQANWPAVSIDREDPGYRTSVQEIRTANREFIALAGRTLIRARLTETH